MDYTKPHLSFDQQVEHLHARGLAIHDRAAAATLLRQVGYYRLSAYAYPLRELLGAEHERTTSVQYRGDRFVTGSSFGLVTDLWKFDRELRLLLLDALEAIEIGLRVQVSYVLGRRDAFGYLSTDSLNGDACARRDGSDTPLWERWIERYRRAQDDARSEDFVRHYVEKYDGRLPIWVSTEIMEFGALVRLFGFLRDDDKSEIARALGISSGKVMHKWLSSANYLRNLCAHHSRLWNRRLTYTIAKPGMGAPARIEHLRELGDLHRKKIYATAAIVAHMVRTIEPETDWPRRFAALISRFPSTALVSPPGDMGFPDGWADLELWR